MVRETSASETAVAEVEEQTDSEAPADDRPRRKTPTARRNRGALPADLPRIARVVEPDSLACPCGCAEMHKIGEDRTERLDIVPAQLRVLVTVRPRHACRACTDGVSQTPAPAALIEGGLPTEGAIAHVLVGKYADHLPLYRRSQMLARSGVTIDRSTLADRVGGRGVPPAARRRPAGRAPEEPRTSLHGRDCRAGSGPGAGAHQDRLPLGLGAR